MFASSNLPNDRLGEILLREGKITVEEYEASIKAITKGKRQGKVLVEMGALSPKDLWEGVQFQVQEIVYSIFQWDEGQFHFEESTLPEKERITVDLDIARPDPGRAAARGRQRAASRRRYPGGGRACWSAWRTRRPADLEPYEEHVLRAGRRRAQRARHLPRERDRRQRDAEGPLRAAVARACCG